MQHLYSAVLSVCFFALGFTFAIFPLEQGQTPEENETRSGSLEALDFWTQSRSYPRSDIPSDRYFKAYTFTKGMAKIPLKSAVGTSGWKSIGPTNFSGRIISIAINPLRPGTIYVGAASGGLWRSYSGGSGGDWQRIATGFPVLGVNAVVVNPSDTNIILIGTGETYGYRNSVGGTVQRTTRGSYGMGILKTIDNGIHWSKSLDWSYNMQRGVQTLRLNPKNPNTVFAATSEGIYKSSDGGTTWRNVLNVIMAQDIAINPTDTMIVLATCGNFSSEGAGVYRSVDGGENFSIVAGLPSFSGKGMLETYAASPNVVYLSLADSTTGDGSLWRTTDAGATWTRINNEAAYGVQGWYSHFVAVHPLDSSRIVRGTDQIFKSTNGGVTFGRIGATWADHHNYSHHPTNPDLLYVVDDGGIWRSTNFGDTYQYVGMGLLTSQFYNGFSCSASDSLLALGQTQDHFGYIYKGSPSWPSSAVDEVGWTAIDQVNDNIMYAGNRGGGSLFKSTNRGISFTGLSTAFSGASCWNSPFVLSSSNPNVLYFGRSKIFKTTTGGAGWTVTNGNMPLDGNPALSMAMSSTHEETLFVGTAPFVTRPHIFRTTDGGVSWTNVTGPLPNRYPMDIAVDPQDSRVVYIAFGGFDTLRVAKSTDAGISWTDISGTLPNVPTTAIFVDPLNSSHVYVGNDIGVYLSTDGGQTWGDFNEGFPEAVLIADLSSSSSNRMIRAATHGNGVFERKMLHTLSARLAVSDVSLPGGFGLNPNYPNPFNSTTDFTFQMMSESFTSLKVYDASGREVETLIYERLRRGSYRIQWNASRFASGVYIARLEAGGQHSAIRMLLLR